MRWWEHVVIDLTEYWEMLESAEESREVDGGAWVGRILVQVITKWQISIIWDRS